MKLANYMTHATPGAVNMNLVERWGSVLAGALMLGSGARSQSGGKLKMLAGGELLRRGFTGHCYAYQAFGVHPRPTGQGASISVPYELGVRARAAVTVNKPRETVYRFWRDFENLPRFMKHLISVTNDPDPRRSRWVAEGPAGSKVEWIAEIHNDVENELIAWRSLPGSEVDSAGSVRFKDAPGNRGTEVLVELQYNPPAGLVGASIAKLFGRDAETEIESDLFRLRAFFETGEVAATEGQPHGPRKRKPAASSKQHGQPGTGVEEQVA
jgi:uncharacterized membrane protein